MSKRRIKTNRNTKDELLYDLEWLQEGQIFPPPYQNNRLDRYEEHKLLFESEQQKVFESALTRIQRIIGDLRDVNIDPVVLNYNKLLSIKTADLVCGEAPKITYGDNETETIDKISEDNGLKKLLYETVIDMSRYGESIWRIYKGEDGKGKITIWEPSDWYPVVSPDDKKRITHHVLARKIYKGIDPTTKVPRYNLYAQIHEKGKYEERLYEIKEKDTVGNLIKSKFISTAFPNDFAVFHLPNVTTSDSVHGHDDYKPVNSIIKELMVRFGQIQKILDKHASPSMKGPMTALEQGRDGRYQFKLANYFATNPNDGDVEYLTWNGDLGSAFTEVEKLIDQLLVISEMGAALLGGVDSAGRAVSGTTMRLRMVNPLMKASRLAETIDPKLRTVINLLSTVGYEAIDRNEIAIEWQDGLPDDPMEEAQLMAIRTGNRPTISQKKAIMILGDLTEEQAEEILQEIKEDEPEVSNFSYPGMDFNRVIDDESEDDDN